MYLQLESKYNKICQELKRINRFIYDNPELGLREFKALNTLTEFLKENNFKIETKFCNIETAFLATYNSTKKGPNIAILAEYDALPDIGHGCGHNLLGTTSVGAGVLLKDFVDEYGGTISIIGTPAEETFGTKVQMAKDEVFKDIDLAMIVHPTSGDYHLRSTSSQAMEALEFKFLGKTSHAAGSPHLGINALDGVINLFNGINALRQQILESDRVHGIIKNGGEAANIIPDLSIAHFYIRSKNRKDLISLLEKVKNCAYGAALSSGTTLEISNYETSFLNLITNKTLMDLYEKQLLSLGIEKMKDSQSSGSTDAGDVSYVCPTIHPYLPLYQEVIGHSKGFAEASITDKAYQGMKEAIFALTLTGIEILKNPIILNEIKSEFIKTMEVS